LIRNLASVISFLPRYPCPTPAPDINISPKVDSISQRRVQCSIPKVEQMLEKFPNIVISRTEEPILRGITITSMIQSARRLRK
jgi:hypothetical protein